MGLKGKKLSVINLKVVYSGFKSFKRVAKNYICPLAKGDYLYKSVVKPGVHNLYILLYFP